MSEFDWQMTLITIAGVAATLFPILYTLVAPWWRSQVGRALVISDVSLALLLDISLLSYWFHFTVSEHVATGILALIAVAALLRCGALLSAQFGHGLRWPHNHREKR